MIPRRAVADYEQRVAQPPGAQILEERPLRLDVLLRSRHQPQKRFTPVLADPPGGQNRFSPLARPQPLGDAVDEQVGNRVLGEIAAVSEITEKLWAEYEDFCKPARDRSRRTVSSVKASSMSRVDSRVCRPRRARNVPVQARR